METLQNAVLINKEHIPNCHFPSQDLQQSDAELSLLKIKLDYAVKLGNNFKSKCKIYFRDDIGLKFVEATLWASCEKNIVLKYGIILPIRRIIDIKY